MPGRAVPNMAIVGVGPDGRIGIFNAVGSADCIVDVMGYVRSESTAAAGIGAESTARHPQRCRCTTGTARGGQRLDLAVAGRGGVPASGVAAVVLNVAALRPTEPGFLTVWPSGLALPDVSNLNYDPGRNVPNLVVCKLGDDGAVSLMANVGELDLIADVVGCFTADGAGVVPVAPDRDCLDPRQASGLGPVWWGPAETSISASPASEVSTLQRPQ